MTAQDIKQHMNEKEAWKADRRRYPRKAWAQEQSIWAIWVYRFGRRNDQRRRGPLRWLNNRIYGVLFKIVETLTGCSFKKGTEIGPGLRIYHFGNIFINSSARLGAHCTLRQGVTIGNRTEDGPSPVIGNNVEFGAYAQVFGGIRVGDNAKIGAMAVVLHDVPTGAVVVGNPAKIVRVVSDAECPRI